MPGPIPKRSDQRRRRNKPQGPTTLKVAGAETVKPPAEDRSWHISAKRWYRSLKHSGQSVFFEPSDWAAAHLCATILSDEMQRPEPVRAAIIAQINSMMDSLLTTEGARRRLRIELQRADATKNIDDNTQAAILLMEKYKNDLTG